MNVAELLNRGNLSKPYNMSIQRRNNEELCNSPSSTYTSSRKERKSENEAIKIETRTVAKKIDIEWNINKQTIDIAKLAVKGEKNGVIGTSVEYSGHTFNLELCVPGWRRSQDGFSAFYLTVPQKASNPDPENNEDEDENNESPENEEKESNDSNNDFVARYAICFGQNENVLTRVSSIRNDFDLGVGFPNFTEIATLVNAVHENELIFKIHVEIFECESSIKKPPKFIHQQSPQTIAAKLISKMYYNKLNCDAVIVLNYLTKYNNQKTKLIKVHKCVLTAASPVFHAFFKHKTKENATSSIFMNQWNVDIVMSMVKFLYLGQIELDHEPNDLCDAADDFSAAPDEEEELGLDFDGSLTDTTDEYDRDIEEETKSTDEEETKSTEQDHGAYEERVPSAKCSLSSLLKNKQKGIDVHNCSSMNSDIINELKFHCPEKARKLFGLFQIAECYEIVELLVACCHALRSYINMETCCIFLIFLDKYTHLDEIKNIKEFILEFIVQNIKSIKSSKGYFFLLQNKPRLLNELIDKLTSNGV